MARPNLETQLADRQDLPDPRRRRRHKIKCSGNRTDVADDRYLRDQPKILTQRRLGIHRHRHEVIADAATTERRRTALVGAGEISLRFGLADKGAATLLARKQSDRGGNCGLADTALAGDEEQLVSEELRHRARASGGSEADAPLLVPAADLDVGDLGRGHCHATTSLVGQPEHAIGLSESLVDIGDDLVMPGPLR